MSRLLIATSNSGKLRDFAGAAARFGVEVAALPGFDSLPLAIEDGGTFEANARKKAEHYSRFAKGELVLADMTAPVSEIFQLTRLLEVLDVRHPAEERDLPSPLAS